MLAEDFWLLAPVLVGCLAVFVLVTVKGFATLATDGRLSKLAQRHIRDGPLVDWSLNAATGLLLIGVMLLVIGSSAAKPQWVVGAITGLVAGAGAYVLARPGGFDPNPRNIALSFAGHMFVGALLGQSLLA